MVYTHRAQYKQALVHIRKWGRAPGKWQEDISFSPSTFLKLDQSLIFGEHKRQNFGAPNAKAEAGRGE